MNDEVKKPEGQEGTGNVAEVIETDDFHIEVVDDVPPEEKPRRAEGDKPPDIPADDDDLEGASKKVRDRIKKLRFEYHEAERQKKDAERIRDEAIKYAKSVSDENQSISRRLQEGQGSIINNAKARLTTEVESAKADFKRAYEAGEADALADAQLRLTKAQAQLDRVSSMRPTPVTPYPTPEQYAQQYNIQPAPGLTPRQQSWLSDNDWFGKDEIMTGTAYGLHEQLVRRGVESDSETYYAEIDKGMRQYFPDKFKASEEEVTSGGPAPANVVAPATRTGKKPRTVRLTSSQLALAKRLGVPPEKYAAQLMKDGQNG